jgi:Na+/proline symporter
LLHIKGLAAILVYGFYECVLHSYISGVSMLGVPAEVYTYGTQHATVLLSEALVAVVTAYVFMPVFYKLQLYSSFEASHVTILRDYLISNF